LLAFTLISKNIYTINTSEAYARKTGKNCCVDRLATSPCYWLELRLVLYILVLRSP